MESFKDRVFALLQGKWPKAPKVTEVRGKWIYAFEVINPITSRLVMEYLVDNDGLLFELPGDQVMYGGASKMPRPTGRNTTTLAAMRGRGGVAYFFFVTRTRMVPEALAPLTSQSPWQAQFNVSMDSSFINLGNSKQPRWALGALDALTVLENQTRRYHVACNQFNAYANSFNSQAPLESYAAERRRLRLVVARMIERLLVLNPSATGFAGTANSPDDTAHLRWDEIPGGVHPARYREAAERALTQLGREKESHAERLVSSLRLLAPFEAMYRATPQQQETDYHVYARVLSLAHCRLSESAAGISYINSHIEGKEKNRYFVENFILRDQPPDDRIAKIAFKIAETLFPAQSSFIRLVNAHNLRKARRVGLPADVRFPNDLDTVLGRSALLMARRLRNVYKIEVVHLQSQRIGFFYRNGHGQTRTPELVDLEYVQPGRTTGVGLGGQELLDFETGLGQKIGRALFERTLALLNVGLAMEEVIEKLTDGRPERRDESFAFVNLISSVTSAASTFNGKLLLTRLPGRFRLAAASAGFFGMATSAISIACAANDTYNSWDKGDFDTALAHGVGGIVGGALSLSGGYLVATTPAGAPAPPAALLMLLAGGLLAAGGYIVAQFTTNTDLQQAIAHSAFGNRAGADDRADAWALCPSGRFTDWDPDSPEGLVRQLRAFNHVLHAFGVQGIRPTIFRIFPRALKKQSVFTIRMRAVLEKSSEPLGTSDVITRETTIQLFADGWKPVHVSGVAIDFSAIDPGKDGQREYIQINWIWRPSQSDPDELDRSTSYRRTREFTVELQLDVDGNRELVLPAAGTGGIFMRYELYRWGRPGPFVLNSESLSTSFHM